MGEPSLRIPQDEEIFMVVHVVTDSGADIPSEIASDLGIVVVPLTVTFGNESYRDLIDLSPDEFYDRLILGEIHPTTSQPSVGSFVEVYKPMRNSSNQILSIHLSSKLSGTLNSATQAAGQEKLGDAIQLIDSEQASMGLGFSVIAAAEAIINGATIDEAAAAAKSALNRTHVFILFDTLKYLERGGRIGRASALLGGFLQIKPILTLDNWEIATKLNVRTFRKGIENLIRLTQECGPLEKVAVLYSTDQSEATALSSHLESFLVADANPLITRISPAIGTHGGPGLIGVICLAAGD